MTCCVKFIGKVVYQIDAIIPRGRAPRRLDVVASHEFAIPLLDPKDLNEEAVIVRPADGSGRLKNETHLAGWNAQLWSPLNVCRHRLPGTDKSNAVSLKSYADGFTAHPSRYEAFLNSDPMLLANRLSAGRFRGHLGFAPPADAEEESEFAGRILWSNKVDAIRRHEQAARHIIVVGETVYSHRHPPCWAVHTDQDEPSFLTMPNFLVTSDKDLIPTELGAIYRLQRLETFGIERRAAAEALSEGRGIAGEVIAYDRSYTRRDDSAWRLYSDIEIVRSHCGRFLPFLSEDGAACVKALTDLAREADFHDLSPFTLRRDEIMAKMCLLAADLTRQEIPVALLDWRKIVLKGLEATVRSCRDKPPEPSIDLAEAEAASLMSLA